MKVLGNRIKSLRGKKKLTQTELGIYVNTSKTTISNYETGYSSPDTETLSKLADILETTTDYLIGRTEISASDEIKTVEISRHIIDISDLPEEAIKQVKDYIEFIRQKCHQNTVY